MSKIAIFKTMSHEQDQNITDLIKMYSQGTQTKLHCPGCTALVDGKARKCTRKGEKLTIRFPIDDVVPYPKRSKFHPFSKMPVKIYSAPPSPPCRAVLLTAKALDLDLEVKDIDLLKGEHKSAAYKRLNPQHTVPFMEDDGFTLSESRAIMEYLVDTYGKTDDLLPKDPKKRALVSSRLYFDATTLYSSFMKAFLAPLFRGLPASDSDFTALREAVSILDTLIGPSNLYLVASQLTIADIAVATTLSNFEVVDYDLVPFKNVTRFYENAKQVIDGFEEINMKGAQVIGNFFKKANNKS